MMRVAFLSTVYGYAYSGADSLWVRAAELAMARGDAVFIGTTSSVAAHPRIDGMIRRGARYSCCQAPTIPGDSADRVRRKFEYLSPNSDSLVSALHEFRPDRVVFSCGGTYDLVREGRVLGLLRIQRIPYWVVANWQTERPFLGPVDLERARACFQNADRLFFVSVRNLEITRRHLGLPLHHAEMIQVPIRLPKPGGAPWPASEVPALAVIARLEPVKALDILLAAVVKSPGLSEPWLLNIYGEGPERAALERQVADLGLGHRVRFHGFVSSLDTIWKDNHCLISASRDEGLPTVMIEALMYARPVIATRVGAATEWIEEGATGFTCEPESVDSLCDAINRAWRVRSSWQGMGAEAHLRSLGKFRPDDALRLVEPAFAVY